MSANVATWIGPGSGTQTSPNTFWCDATGSGSTWTVQFQFFNASNGLVTVNVTVGIYDITAGSLAYSGTFTGVNTANIGPVSLTSGHSYAYYVQYNSSSCDHCTCAQTGSAGSNVNHPIFYIYRSGVWQPVDGSIFFIYRSGAWSLVYDGFWIYRSGAWVMP